VQQRLALVVVDDPQGRVIAPRDRWLIDERFRVADSVTAELRVAGTADRLTLVRRADRVTALDARCTINGEVPRGNIDVRAGDVVGVGDVVLRVVAADLFDRLRQIGDWLVLENLWASRDAGVVFGPLSSSNRGFAWLLSASLDNDDVTAFARAGGGADGLAAVKDTIVDGDEIAVVFDVTAHVSLSAFRTRATSLGAPPLPVALRVGRDLNGALLALWDSAHRLSSLDAVVTFDGRTLLRPTARPWERSGPPARRPRYTPAQARALAKGTSRDDDMGFFEDDAGGGFDAPDAALVAEVVCGLAPDHVELQTLLQLQQEGPLSPLVVESMLRRLARGSGVADDDELAGVVCGLFPDEHRRALALAEELELLDAAAVGRLIRHRLP
jgi:hypothetical protein